MGLAAYLGRWYAWRKAGLVAPEVSMGEAVAISKRNLAEPVTAVLTIPFAFVGPIAWELSWFLYPGLRYLLGRRQQRG